MIRRQRRRNPQSGLTLIELMIAILVLMVGLLGMAKLFIYATLNTALAVNESQGVADAQKLIEAYKIEAATNGISSTVITSGTYVTATDSSPAYLAGTGGRSAEFNESVWVFDKTGTLVNPAGNTVNPATPTDPVTGYTYAANELKSPSSTSRLVYVLLTPKVKDPRYNQAVRLMDIVSTN